VRGRDVGTGIGGGGGETGGLCVVGGKCGPRWRACQCMLCVDAMRMICLAHTHPHSLSCILCSFFLPFLFFSHCHSCFVLSLSRSRSLPFFLSLSLSLFFLSVALSLLFHSLSLCTRVLSASLSLSSALSRARSLALSRARSRNQSCHPHKAHMKDDRCALWSLWCFSHTQMSTSLTHK